MVNPTNSKAGITLSISLLLETLFKLSSCFFRNEVDFFCTLFSSYHELQSSYLEYEWKTPQSTVNRVLHNRIPIPRYMLVYYACSRGNARLRADISRFLQEIITTPSLRHEFYETLHSLVICSTNLSEAARTHILGFTDCSADEQLTELLYRMSVVLMYEAKSPQSA